MNRRDCLRYLLILPGMLFVGVKRLWACSNPYPIYISNKDIYGDNHTIKSKYLNQIYKRSIHNDKGSTGKIIVANAENEREIPVTVSLTGLKQGQHGKAIELYIEAKYETDNGREIFSYYKLGGYKFYNNSVPYISSRYKAVGRGDSINVIAIAIIEDGSEKRLIKFESGQVGLSQCNPLVPVDSDEVARRNNECIDARSWFGYQWDKIERTDYCRKLYKSLGWPIFK